MRFCWCGATGKRKTQWPNILVNNKLCKKAKSECTDGQVKLRFYFDNDDDDDSRGNELKK